jgi:integrase
MTKRANGEGSVRQRPNGRWEARFTYVDPVSGERLRRSFYGRTQREVRDSMREAAERVAQGQPATDATVTVSQWVDQWVATTLAASSRRPSTKALCETLLAKHVQTTRLASVRLDRLRPSHIDALVLELRGRTKQRKDGVVVRALADSSIQRVWHVLRSCLGDAVRDGLLARNPVDAVGQPAATRPEARHLSPAEVVAVLQTARGTRAWALFALIAATGVRKGEALALRWSDVDLDAGTLTVRHTLSRVRGQVVLSEPKTAKSRRVLPLSDALVRVLRDQRRQQLEERVAAANVWHDTGHVFTTATGEPMEGRNVLRAFTTAAAKAGVQDANVHSLRHSAATAMLDNGVHLRAVSELLGHQRHPHHGRRLRAPDHGHS